MKNLFFTTIIGFVLFTGCINWGGVKGSGKIREEIRTVPKFEAIDLSGSFLAEIECGANPSLKIIAEDNIIPLIAVKVKDGKLQVYTKKSVSPRKEIKLVITVGDLKSIESSGASSLLVTDINNDDLMVNCSGASSIELFGRTEKFEVNISGAADLKAGELKAEIVNIDISGASNAIVFAAQSLNAQVSGVGNIDYYGNPPKIKTNVSGVGSINKK